MTTVAECGCALAVLVNGSVGRWCAHATEAEQLRREQLRREYDEALERARAVSPMRAARFLYEKLGYGPDFLTRMKAAVVQSIRASTPQWKP